ncbi:transcription initiation factor TFIID subunit 4-like [Neosynchiropus ocellatus]
MDGPNMMTSGSAPPGADRRENALNGSSNPDGSASVENFPSGTVLRTSDRSSPQHTLKPEPTVTLVRPPVQTASAYALANRTEPMHTHPIVPSSGTVGTAPNGRSPTVVQNIRTSAGPVGGIRAFTPQNAVPRPNQAQRNAASIQLPPGMVLVRNETGQLLMIHHQALAQIQGQSPGTMAPRPVVPTSPAQMTSLQTPNSSPHVHPITPTAIAKQGSPVPTSTATPQRPPILQNTAMMGGGVPPPRQLPGTTVQPGSPGAAPPIPVTAETLENVKKCRNFLSTLIKLASSGKQSAETIANVKQLVKNLLESKLEPEEFTSSLYKELNSPPQPYLVPFLKRSLPALRQMTPDSEAFIHQSLMPQGSTQPPAAPRPPLPAATTTIPALKSPFAARVHAVGPGLQSAAPNAKPKDPASFKEDDDINDVASMAGVNLSEESARILATNSVHVGAVTRSCKDEAFLSASVLTRKVLEIGKRFGVSEVSPDVINFVSHGAQHRLRNLLETVSRVAQQRNVTFKEDGEHEQSSDVRGQLKFFEQLDQMEKQKKEDLEREILLKVAKSRSRQEDPEQLRLKQKAREMQQQEQAQIQQREANQTALAAIGPRKKRLIDSPFRGFSAEGAGSSPTRRDSPGGGGASRQFTRQRITRVNLKDLLFCLENERVTRHSHLLYKGFLK